MSEELKPCPFCGGAAKLVHGGAGCHFVLCGTCSGASDDGSEEHAVAAWNRRPFPARKRGQSARGLQLSEMPCAPGKRGDMSDIVEGEMNGRPLEIREPCPDCGGTGDDVVEIPDFCPASEVPFTTVELCACRPCAGYGFILTEVEELP